MAGRLSHNQIAPVPIKSLRCALPALLAATMARAGAAQEAGPVALRGAVVAAESGERLPFALVSLDGGSRRFASETGLFLITGLEPGSYRLQVRQVGFRPFDSTVTLGAASPPLRIELQRLAVELRAIDVGNEFRCRNPGAPGAASGALNTIFEQLKLNAQRHALLVDQYPFRYTVERELANELRDGSAESLFDTLSYRSDSRWPYRPGLVLTPDTTLGSSTQVVHFPILADLADSVFHATHCFQFAGTDSLEGGEWLRIDFKTDERLRTPDVDGSAYLHPTTYQVRYTRFVVTRLDRFAPGVAGFTATATFRELQPWLLVIERLRATTSLRFPERRGGSQAVVGRFEHQRLLRVDFLRPLAPAPDGAP